MAALAEVSTETSKISATALTRILDQLKNQQHQSSTQKVYYSVWKKFNEFLIRVDHLPNKWEERVELYIGFLIHVRGLQSCTIKSYVSGIKSVLTRDGYQWDGELLVLSAITRGCKLKNDHVKTRLPVRRGLLEMILFQTRRRFKTQVYLRALYLSMFLVAYYGLMRVGELCLGPHVVKVVNVHSSTNKSKFLFVLHSSKTHGRDSRPQKISITGHTLLEVSDADSSQNLTVNCAVSENIFCPFKYTKQYSEMRPCWRDEDEPFYVFSDGTPVKPNQFRQTLREILTELGLDAAMYDTHSFRIGRATDLFKVDHVSVDVIKQLGQWKSNAVYKYLRD